MADHAERSSGINLSDSSYDVLRQFVEKVFPGLGVLYAALATLWGWGYILQVGGSLSAIAVFGGILLSMSRKNYVTDPSSPPGGYDGAVVQDINEAGEAVLRLELTSSATEEIMNKPQIVFKGYDAAA